MGYLDQILHAYVFNYPATGKKIKWWLWFAEHHLAGRDLIVKILITLEPHGIF